MLLSIYLLFTFLRLFYFIAKQWESLPVNCATASVPIVTIVTPTLPFVVMAASQGWGDHSLCSHHDPARSSGSRHLICDPRHRPLPLSQPPRSRLPWWRRRDGWPFPPTVLLLSFGLLKNRACSGGGVMTMGG